MKQKKIISNEKKKKCEAATSSSNNHLQRKNDRGVYKGHEDAQNDRRDLPAFVLRRKWEELDRRGRL